MKRAHTFQSAENDRSRREMSAMKALKYKPNTLWLGIPEAHASSKRAGTAVEHRSNCSRAVSGHTDRQMNLEITEEI